MKLLMIPALCLGLLTLPAAAQQKGKTNTKTTTTTLKTTKDSLSYSIGVNIGQTLKQQAIDVNAETLSKGIADILTGGDRILTDAQVQEVLNNFQQQMMAKQTEMASKVGDKNAQEGAAFLANNAKRAGVKVLPSGLQYEVITDGTGPMPTPADNVTTHYKGTLIDGTTFDSSYDRGEPATFPVGGVIKGWTEALQLMKVGSKWKLYIPSDLAYGANGAGQSIGPNATLVFEVELLKIEGK